MVLPVQYTIDGLTLGVSDPVGATWYVEKTTGWAGAPPTRPARAERPAGMGTFRSAGWRKERIITLAGHCKTPTTPTRLAAQDQLSAVCSDPTRLYTLQVTDQTGRVRTADVELDGDVLVAVEDERWFGWSLQLAAPDPRKHDGSWVVVETPLPAPGPGGVDATTPGVDATTPGVSSGPPGLPGIVSAANVGTAPAYPVLELVGRLNSPSVRVLDTGQTLNYSATVPPGHSLWINTGEFPALGLGARTVLLDQTSSRRPYLALPLGWPVLAPGTRATFTITDTSTDPAARLRLWLRNAWW